MKIMLLQNKARRLATMVNKISMLEMNSQNKATEKKDIELKVNALL